MVLSTSRNFSFLFPEYENCYEKAMVDASVYNHTPSCHSNSLQCITNLPDDLRSFDQRHFSRIRRHYLLHVWCFFILLATSKPHPSHIALGGLLGGLVLFSWQRILLHRYWSAEWFMLFFAPCICLIVLVTIFKFAFLYWGDSKNKIRQKQHHVLNLIGAGLWYILFTIITSFFSAMAFDCGI